MEDAEGNALTAFLPAACVADVPDDAPMPAALVAVWCGRHLLLVYDRFRGQWELPGGRIDPGETPLHRRHPPGRLGAASRVKGKWPCRDHRP
ncbi:hypothetical protein GCM10029978_018650 [Actinoallomurus acanthiterrae]